MEEDATQSSVFAEMCRQELTFSGLLRSFSLHAIGIMIGLDD